jgi:glycosyltransferase involved in cell wall biosynthesis
MSIVSPWSRQLVYRLRKLGHEIVIIDFAQPRCGSYIDDAARRHAEDLERLCGAANGLVMLNTRFKSSLRYVTCARRVRSACHRHGADVLLALYGGGFAILALLSGIRPYAAYVVGTDILEARGFQRWLTSRALLRASAVFANGDYLAEKTRELTPHAQITPLVMGIDPQRFQRRAVPRPKATVLCTRGFLPVYNNELIVQALRYVPPECPAFDVVFSAGGPQLDGVRRTADRVLPASIRPNVTFLDGISDDEMLTHLQTAEVFVSMSRSDGTSISLLEAMSCGIFPILSDIPQNRCWVQPQLGNGILVSLDAPADLAQAVAQALMDERRRAHAAGVNRRIILERADAHKNTALLASQLTHTVSHALARKAAKCCSTTN